jgi:arylformamidase
MGKHIYDISLPLSERTPVWPTSERYLLKWKKTMEKDGVNESCFSLNTHTGTHIDVPYHFRNSGNRVGDISLERLMGNALVVECCDQKLITPEFLSGIDVPPGCTRMLFKTRNSFDNIIEQESFREDYVALNPEGAEWIVRNNFDLVGIDYLSIQSFGEDGDRTHKILLENDVLIIEGLDLRKVSRGVYALVALPLSIPEAEGAPVRAVLIKEDY